MKPGYMLAAKYRLEHVLGSGGMGEVWAAVNEVTGRPCAVKLVNNSTPQIRARMLREARAMGTLKHRNIVDIYDVGQTEDADPFLVMELLTGETLADRLDREGSLDPATAVAMATSIASALRAAHAKGIIHRDLKPANVFLHREGDDEGEILKVLDFGVSKHLQDPGTITAGLLGTPAYMSPEQACQEVSIDARSDLWSLGVVLFQMLAGRRPFNSSSPYLVITEVVNGPIPSLTHLVPGINPPLAHLVQRCLTRELDARVASADEVIRLLGSCLVPLPLDASRRYAGTPQVAGPHLPALADPSSVGAGTLRLRAVANQPAPRTLPSSEPAAVSRREVAPVSADSRRIPADAPSVGAPSSGSAVAGTSSPLASIDEATEPLATTGEHPRVSAAPTRGPSNTVLALIAGAAGLLLMAEVSVALGLVRPTPGTASSVVASPAPIEARPTVAPSILAPAPVATPPAIGGTASPAVPPQNKDDAPTGVDAPSATPVSPPMKRVGTTPIGSGRRPPTHTDRDGRKVWDAP